MNLVIETGRLTRDPEVRYNGEMAIARYTLAVDRTRKSEGQPDADFIRCVAFGKSGEFAEKYLKKGVKILVQGHIQTGSYEKDGQKVNTFEVVVDKHEFCESKSANKSVEEAEGFMPMDVGEDLPFA